MTERVESVVMYICTRTIQEYKDLSELVLRGMIYVINYIAFCVGGSNLNRGLYLDFNSVS